MHHGNLSILFTNEFQSMLDLPDKTRRHTLNVIILKREIFPPEADITYESFFESAKHGTASSGVVSLISFVIKIPLEGCHNCGTMLVVAYKKEHIYDCQAQGIKRRDATF